jgi:hypothetical protein
MGPHYLNSVFRKCTRRKCSLESYASLSFPTEFILRFRRQGKQTNLCGG